MKVFQVIVFTIFELLLSATQLFAANKISYTEAGSGQPIILIHAFPTDQRLWQPQLSGLKQHFRVIALDLMGFGESSPVSGSAISMTAYADQVKALLDQLHIQKAIIGGESMGGYIALAFLKKYPNTVSGLVLSNTQAIADSDDAKAKREETAQALLKEGTAQFVAGFLTKALSPNASQPTKDSLQTILNAQPATAMAAALRGMSLREDQTQLLANTKVPILIISSDNDVVIEAKQSTDMQQLAKNSKLVIINQAGHLSNLEQPQQWNQAVMGFFNKE